MYDPYKDMLATLDVAREDPESLRALQVLALIHIARNLDRLIHVGALR